MDNSEPMNINEGIQDLRHDHPALGLGQLELRLGEGGEQVAALQVLGDDDALTGRLIELNHLDDELAVLQLVEEPRLAQPVPALLL